jgi:hypothetical protein
MIRLLLVLTLFAPMTLAQQTLASYIDRSRVLLVFAPNDEDPRYQQQLTSLNHYAAEVKERDLIILPVLIDPGPPITPNTMRVTFGPGLPEQEQMLARRRFKVGPTEFTALLVGKDGGEKLRSHQPLSIEELNRTIDAMPMRQQEMRKQP